MDYIIRKLEKEEVKVLDTFLYEAIFIPEGAEAPSRDIINLPELQVYIKDFGNKMNFFNSVFFIQASKNLK